MSYIRETIEDSLIHLKREFFPISISQSGGESFFFVLISPFVVHGNSPWMRLVLIKIPLFYKGTCFPDVVKVHCIRMNLSDFCKQVSSVTLNRPGHHPNHPHALFPVLLYPQLPTSQKRPRNSLQRLPLRRQKYSSRATKFARSRSFTAHAFQETLQEPRMLLLHCQQTSFRTQPEEISRELLHRLLSTLFARRFPGLRLS